MSLRMSLYYKADIELYPKHNSTSKNRTVFERTGIDSYGTCEKMFKLNLKLRDSKTYNKFFMKTFIIYLSFLYVSIPTLYKRTKIVITLKGTHLEQRKNKYVTFEIIFTNMNNGYEYNTL